MKRSIIALVAAMSVVGVAGATISMRPTEGGKSPLLATSTAPHVAVDRPSELRPNTVAKASPTEVQKAALEPLGTPVPLQLKSRVPAKLPDGEGSLLDHSLVLYGSGMSNADVHDHVNLPILVAGGGAGRMKGGRHIRYSQPTPLANLHLTLLDKAGVRLDSFADSQGRIPELLEPLAV
mgnify:CR=1 FL=1